MGTTNPIPWRGDSCLSDSSGYQLGGGYYDGGDSLKFTYPIATTVSFMAWSMLEFGDGYT
jgi:endoglucanase